MTPRKLLGAIALGAPAALLAHMALFGEGHTLAGQLHDVVLDGALAAAALFAIAFALLAWRGAAVTSAGSVLAGKLFTYLPGPFAIFCGALTMYAGIESLEVQHAPANLALLIGALFAVSMLLHTIAKIVAYAFAGIAIAIATTSSYELRATYTSRAPQRRFFAAPYFVRHRRFARPPPSLQTT